MWRHTLQAAMAILLIIGGSAAQNDALEDAYNPFSDAQVVDISQGSASAFGLAVQFNQSGPQALQRLKYQATATVAYNIEPIPSSGAMSFACGFGYVAPEFQAAYIGVGPSFFQRGFGCGRCVTVQCDDSSCSEPGKQVVAQVVELCGECYDSDIRVAHPLFSTLSGRPPAGNPTISASWNFVDCAPLINGTIKMLVKPGGTAYYQAFNFANSRQPIVAVQVNRQLLKHDSGNFWSWTPVGGAINTRGPFEFALMGEDRQVLRARLPQLRSADLGVQFRGPPTPAPAPNPETRLTLLLDVKEDGGEAPAVE